MTLFDLVLRNMKKNVKHYYLYFFALIFSVALYFVFASLQFDTTVAERTALSGSMTSGFKVANILLIVIAGIFIIYANSIFLTRRSKEIGLYQLIGLTKNAVAKMLIIENVLLSFGALIVGILTGTVVSRLFLLLLLKVVGIQETVQLQFSMDALKSTLFVFTIIIVITSIQMIRKVYKKTLIQLFKADQATEIVKEPKGFITAILAIGGIGFIVFGYWLSGNMMNQYLLFNMLLVLFSTIFGSYLVFRVSIGWVLGRIRKMKKGHMSLKDSLSIAPLMHRMKGNAQSLTIITTLSAMAMTMIAISYSLYYSNAEVTRQLLPNDFQFSEEPNAFIGSVEQLKQFEERLTAEQIDYERSTVHAYPIELSLEEAEVNEMVREDLTAHVVSTEELSYLGYDWNDDYAALHYSMLYWAFKDTKMPVDVQLRDGQKLIIHEFSGDNIFNLTSFEANLVVSPAQYERLKQYQSGEESPVRYAISVSNHELEQAQRLFEEVVEDEVLRHSTYYEKYQSMRQSSGLMIFIAGFLGLVFLISTGSILYFKQMTEAEQEKQSYKTLRQLGFSTRELLSGIRRKQVFVFGLPLMIGLLHSWFAVQSANIIFMTDVTVPTLIAMGVYSLIYLSFAVLTMGYYKKVVKQSM